MAGRIPQTFIDDLIARTDVVELIGSRVQLKKSGREFKARCPFHDEKSPSFWVSPEKQFYHCFGCGAHGTALGFLMNYDKLSFPEAVEELASRAGIDVPRESGAEEARAPVQPLFDLTDRVASHYTRLLTDDARAAAYARARELLPETLQHFRIGYAANSWNDVLRRFGTDDARARGLAEAGLIIERDGGQLRDGERHYDRFRDRLMFPIRDARGRVIAFGGRVIDAGEPKYLNSPETALFHKGRELYGLYETRQNRAPLTRLLVVEGYMDVVRLHQAGIPYAVATLGTATTPEQLRLVFKLVREVVFAFDGDRAGRAAAWRAATNALPEAREGRELRFLFLPDGHDPDSLVGAEGRAAFEQRLETAVPLSEYLVSQLSADLDLKHADGRARFADAARPLFARVPPGVYRELLLERIAAAVGLPSERLRQLWSTAGTATDGHERGIRPASHPGTVAQSAGRGGLVRQAVTILVHYPTAAVEVEASLIDALLDIDEGGVSILRDLLLEARAVPLRTTAQLLERWRDRPEVERLARLARQEMLIVDARAAGRELAMALRKLVAGSDTRQIDALLDKDRKMGLDSMEKQQLQLLMSNLAARKGA